MEARRRPRGGLLTIGLLLLSGLTTSTCGEDPIPDPVTYPGTWVGYFSLENTNYPSATTLEIGSDLSTDLQVFISGSTLAWQTFSLEVTGSPIIDDDDTCLGAITITRYRAGRDTLTATGVISGAFNRPYAQVLGEWLTDPGQPFSALGQWGAVKQTASPSGVARP